MRGTREPGAETERPPRDSERSLEVSIPNWRKTTPARPFESFDSNSLTFLRIRPKITMDAKINELIGSVDRYNPSSESRALGRIWPSSVKGRC